MKNLLKYLSIISVGFMFACEPLDETYQELDEQVSNDTEFSLTLSEDQYEAMEDLDGVPSYVYNDYYFMNDEEAASFLPEFLNSELGHLGSGAFGTVNYNVLDFAYEGSSVDSTIYYTVSDEDYDALGHNFGNFDATAEIFEFLDYKFEVENGTHVVLTYDFYNGSRFPQTQEQTDGYYFAEDSWNYAFRVTEEYYEIFERNRFNNFTSADDDNLEGYFSYILANEFFTASAGDIQFISYAYYNGDFTEQLVQGLKFNGSEWVFLAEENVLMESSLNFENREGEWVPDLTLRYELTANDYAAVAANPDLGDEPARENLSTYGNFSTFDWSDEQITEAIIFVLGLNFPDVEAGQKINVTYSIFDGATGNRSQLFEYSEDGTFVDITGQ